jgi:hypothetical protein
LKALFLKNGRELDQPITFILQSNFPQLEVLGIDLSNGDIIDVINESGQISIIIINVNHKPINLIHHLESITESLGVLPMVFICTPQSIKTHLNEKILDNNTTNFIVNLPLSGNKLQLAVQAALVWIKETEFQQSVGEFTFDDLQPMRIKNFFIFTQVPYDVYVQLTSNQFGKIIQGNHPYSHQKIQTYAQKGVKYLYLRKDENLKFLTTSIINISKFYDAKNIEKKKLILLHQQSIFFIREFIKVLSVTDEVVKLTQLFIESSSQFIRTDTALNEIFEIVIQKRTISFAQQTLLSIYLARAILLKMRWTSDMALNKIALASILQDITLNNDDLIKIRSIHDPYLKSFSELEQQEFLEHTEKAAIIARLFNGFPDVDFILSEHHERPTSDGFPKGGNASSLTAISCIFILVTNVVSKLSQHSTYSPQILREITVQLKSNFHGGNFKEPFRALEKIVKEMNG